MELFFLALLLLLMIMALSMGFPVAFALPGSAIISVVLAGVCGYLFAGDVNAFFAQDGPTQWLSAGVTNFRSLYWIVERDTLIAIPLFVFMGIMLQRSKIAEDLLVAMAQLFGPVPGGLGISVVFVGALLAATTGIVGATVIAMGLISLPAMLRNNYAPQLATGTICASGTLGQIIPPSIVLIILADQLSSAADQASTTRKAEYREATGEFGMPSELDITSASAGDMFMGALVPGLILVGLYMLYILIIALIKPHSAPPVPFAGNYDRKFVLNVVLALVPPLSLIFVVLGSIISGVATVNQAGAIGAIGAMIMGGYRLTNGKAHCYTPALLAIASVILILVITSIYDINIKNIRNDSELFAIWVAFIGVIGLLVSVVWSGWRAYQVDETLHGVMIDTAKTTSMVFIILIGAAMLTSAFRGFGGEELVKHYLTTLPGGFWTQFLVVMLVIFLLGFFLDFIEIAVVVVPIVAPILLADPSANITAVWLGVMIGLNIQTSFLTPPFGFALFYLRGVAPPSVKTTHIYKGAIVFIILQLLGLSIAGFFPSLVNYLPYKTYLVSDNAPPPINPRLQQCLEPYVFSQLNQQRGNIENAVIKARELDISYLPDSLQKSVTDSLNGTKMSFGLIEAVNKAETARISFEPQYRPLHTEVRSIEKEIRKIGNNIGELKQRLSRVKRNDSTNYTSINKITDEIATLETRQKILSGSVPESWQSVSTNHQSLVKAEKKARSQYRLNVDSSYENLTQVITIIETESELDAAKDEVNSIGEIIKNKPANEAMESIKQVEKKLSRIAGTTAIKSKLSKSRRALKGDTPNVDDSMIHYNDAKTLLAEDLVWRGKAKTELLPALEQFNDAIKHTIGLRLQARLTTDQAKTIAACQSHHKDVSLSF